MYAYHGSKSECFYSILNYGLQQHLCKVNPLFSLVLFLFLINMKIFQTALFGEGIYLSSEPHVSLHFSPFGSGWRNSRFGKEFSCLALCEFVNHPEHLKCQTKGNFVGIFFLHNYYYYEHCKSIIIIVVSNYSF